MKTLKKVRPEDFDVEALLVAAREGRLYVDGNLKTVSKEQLVNNVRAYVRRIKVFATPEYCSKVDEIWEQILSTAEFADYLKPKTKARLCREFDKYNVMRIICVLREKGVYQPYSDRKFDAMLEPGGRDSPYRRYLGMGIDDRSLVVKIRKIVEQYKL